MQFQLSSLRDAEACEGPLVVLEHIPWDDHGHRNTFRTYLKPTTEAPPQELGEVKILQRGTERPRFPVSFESLPEDCCSLGQSLEYYERVDAQGMLGSAVLQGLRDLKQAPEGGQSFTGDEGYTRSLLRLPSARYLLAEATGQLPTSLRVSVRTKLAGLAEDQPVSLELELDPGRLGGRTGVLVGANGTGKTQLLARIAHAMVVDDELLTGEPKPAVSRVLAFSFSAFDQFQLPQPPFQDLYWYCGLRQRAWESRHGEAIAVSVKPEDWGLDALFSAVCAAPSRRARWETAMRRLEISSAIPNDEDEDELKLLHRIRPLGAGHKMACLGFTHLLAHLRRRTLVLFDEPELHTHPRLLSLMMRELALLLEEYESFAVISTHSPIVLQEVPARQIRVLRRDDDHLHISKYPGESFGEDLNEIVRLGFGLDHDERSYLKILREEVERDGLARVREKHAGSMGLSALLALASLEETES